MHIYINTYMHIYIYTYIHIYIYLPPNSHSHRGEGGTMTMGGRGGPGTWNIYNCKRIYIYIFIYIYLYIYMVTPLRPPDMLFVLVK